MKPYRLARHICAVFLVLGGTFGLSEASAADHLENEDISRVWSRLDLPVQNGSAVRTWFWGPEPITDLHEEYYADVPGEKRLVIYFDKTRMEINPDAEPGSVWRVTNGLLATELITGQVQLGDETFVDATAPEINVAGDPDDPDGLTYDALSGLVDADALPEGTTITQTVSRSGIVTTDSTYGSYQVTALRHIPETDHTVASVFWEYVTSRGPVYQDGEYLDGPLFENELYGVGYPITEAYWTTVRVAGVDQPVLVQAFQRRVLTYTPNNADGWQVEAGNVGRHYLDWRASLGDLLNSEGDEDVAPSDDGSEASNDNPDDCNGESVNVSENGTVKQSNSATVNQSGSENQSVTCTQKNTSVKR